MVGRLSPQKVKITKKIVLRLECAEPKCISKGTPTIKRQAFLTEKSKKRKGQVI